jgi:hypothetical protein
MWVKEPLVRVRLSLFEYLYALAEDQTCADLCDKDWEQQGCPSGTCARYEGLAEMRRALEIAQGDE